MPETQRIRFAGESAAHHAVRHLTGWRAYARLLVTPKAEDERLLVAARRFVDVHLGDRELSLDRVARHIHLSRRQVQRIYEAAGTSYSADVLSRRMNRARELLERGEPSRQVAVNVGYGSGSALAKAFRRRFGTPLSQVAPEKPPFEQC